MAVMLDQIVFEVNTTDLDDAYAKVGKLADAVEQLNAPLTALTGKSTKVAKAITDVAESAEKTSRSVKKVSETTEDAANSMSKVERIIQKQIETMKVMRDKSIEAADGIVQLGDGFTKSQSGQIANLKLMGATKDQIESLASSMRSLNEFSGVNPFDKSASGLFKLQKEMKELSDVNELSTKNIKLTKEQVIMLSRDITRLKQSLEEAGVAEKDQVEQLNRLQKEYSEAAKAVNELSAKAKEAEKIAKDSATKEASYLKGLVQLRKETYQNWITDEEQAISARSKAWSDHYGQMNAQAEKTEAEMKRLRGEVWRDLALSFKQEETEIQQRRKAWADHYAQVNAEVKQGEELIAKNLTSIRANAYQSWISDQEAAMNNSSAKWKAHYAEVNAEIAKGELVMKGLRNQAWRDWANDIDNGEKSMNQRSKDWKKYFAELEKSQEESQANRLQSFKYYLAKVQQDQDTYKAIMQEMKNDYERGNSAFGVLETPASNKPSADEARRVKEIAAAKKYLTQVQERLNEALSEENAGISNRYTDQLAKIKRNIELLGTEAEKSQFSLEKMSEQLRRVAHKEDSDRLRNLARDMSVQMGDVAVSLASGMNPLMVMIQQGDQMRFAIEKADLSAKEMQKSMQSAAAMIATSFINTGKVVGSFVTGTLTSLSEGLAKVVFSAGKVERAAKFDEMIKGIKEAKESGVALDGTMLALARSIPMVAAGIGLFITAAITTAVASVKLLNAQDDLNKSLTLTGARFGLSTESAKEYAFALSNKVGISATKVMELIGKISSTTELSSKQMTLAIESAVKLERVAGVSFDKTISQFEKMRDKPVESLLELAKATGSVNLAVLEQVIQLNEQGRASEAAVLAIQALADANEESARRIEDTTTPLGRFKIFMSEMFDSLGKTAIDWANTVLGAFEKVFNRAAQLKKQFLDTPKPEGSASRNDILSAFPLIGAGRFFSQILDKKNSPEVNKPTVPEYGNSLGKLKSDAASLAVDSSAESLKYESEALKTAKERSLIQEKIAKAEKLVTSSKNELELLGEAGNIKAMEEASKVYDSAKKSLGNYQKALSDFDKKEAEKNSKKKDPLAQFEDSAVKKFIEMQNAAIGKTDELSAANIELLNVMGSENWNKLSAPAKARITDAALEADALQTNIKLAKEKADAEELVMSITGKAAEYTKDYNKQTAQLAKYFQSGGFGDPMSDEALAKYREVIDLLNAAQPAVKQNTEALAKWNEEVAKNNDTISVEQQQLDLRNKMLGMTTEEQRLLNIETAKFGKILQINKKYDQQVREVSSDSKIKDEEERQRIIRDLNNQRINEIAIAEKNAIMDVADFYRSEMQQVAADVSDVLYDLIFKKDKTAGKRFRDIIEQQLKKPFVVSVTATVEKVLGAAFGKSSGLTGQSSFSDFAKEIGSTMNKSFSSSFQKFATSAFGEKLGMSSEVNGPTQDGTGRELSKMGQILKSGFEALGKAKTAEATRNLISNGYEVGNGKLVNAATAIGAQFDPTGGYISGAIAGIFNRLFGKKLKDTGIEGTFGTSGFSGNSYQFYKGGWFSSDKMKKSALDNEFTQSLNLAYTQSKATLGAYAESVGLSSKSIAEFTKSVKISMKGLSEEQAQAKIQEEFEKIQEEMAKSALSASYVKKETETWAEALERLSTSLSGVNALFKKLGYDLFDSSVKAADLASKIVDAFGDLNSMTALVGSYYENYYSEAEKTSIVTKNLTDSMKELGYSLPTSREEFRKLVESQDLTTASGRETYAALLNLADAFALITDSSDELINSLQDTIDTLKEAAIQNVESAISQLENAIDTSKQLQETWQSISDDIKKYLSELISTSGAKAFTEELALAKRNFLNAIGDLKSGKSTSASDTTSYASDYLSSQLDIAASAEDYARAVAEVRRNLSSVAGVADANVNAEKLKQQLAEDTLSVLNDLLEYLESDSVTKNQLNEFSDKLGESFGNLPTDIKSAMQESISGLNKNVVDLVTALDELVKKQVSVAISTPIINIHAGSDATPSETGTPEIAQGIKDIITKVVGWKDKFDVNGFAQGGTHMGGLRIVGENGPELEATGSSKIWTASQTQGILSGASGGLDEEDKQLLRDLLSEMKDTNTNIKSGLYSVAKNSQKTADQLSRWDGDGMPETRT